MTDITTGLSRIDVMRYEKHTDEQRRSHALRLLYRAVSRIAAAGSVVFVLCACTTDIVRAQVQRQESAPTRACDTLEYNFTVDEPAFISPSDFLPSFLRDQILLKQYIRDPRFMAIRRLCTDTAAVDAIYLRALDIADNDRRYALFIALWATMDHFRLGLKIPLLGVLWLPLTTETDSVFGVRRAHLPRKVLPDSIGRTMSDKDKLQHFFGSAYLAYLTNSRSLANLFGNSIEVGEEAFVVGGMNDDRDRFANRLGQEFGLRLLDEEEIVPSDVLWKKGAR